MITCETCVHNVYNDHCGVSLPPWLIGPIVSSDARRFQNHPTGTHQARFCPCYTHSAYKRKEP